MKQARTCHSRLHGHISAKTTCIHHTATVQDVTQHPVLDVVEGQPPCAPKLHHMYNQPVLPWQHQQGLPLHVLVQTSFLQRVMIVRPLPRWIWVVLDPVPVCQTVPVIVLSPLMDVMWEVDSEVWVLVTVSFRVRPLQLPANGRSRHGVWGVGDAAHPCAAVAEVTDHMCWS
jgi:hypothetical protein